MSARTAMRTSWLSFALMPWGLLAVTASVCVAQRTAKGEFDSPEDGAIGRRVYFAGIGIDHYENDQWPPLKGASTDLTRLRDVLGERYGVSIDVSNDDYPQGFFLRDTSATSRRVAHLASEFAKQAEKDSANIIFYFSGHGAELTGDEVYLIPHDGQWLPSSDWKDELTALELKGSGWISLSEILEDFRTRDIDQVLVIVDACKAGSYNPEEFGTGVERRARTRELITAAAYRQDAYEYEDDSKIEDEVQGVFTSHLHQELNAAWHGAADGRVSFRDIMGAVRDTMEESGRLEWQQPTHGRFHEDKSRGLFTLTILNEEMRSAGMQLSALEEVFRGVADDNGPDACNDADRATVPEVSDLGGPEQFRDYELMEWYVKWSCEEERPELAPDEKDIKNLRELDVGRLELFQICREYRLDYQACPKGNQRRRTDG